jgi:phage-related minor tail protein
VREAVAALGEAVTRSSEESEAALTGAGDAADDFAESLDAAGAAARGAGGAARAAGAEAAAASEEMAEAAEETIGGWQAVTAALAEYAEKAREIGGDIGQALVGAFQGAENAVADFVKSGKLSIRDLVTSTIAELARLGARRFLLGPLAGASPAHWVAPAASSPACCTPAAWSGTRPRSDWCRHWPSPACSGCTTAAGRGCGRTRCRRPCSGASGC